jgi:hypothetical protein
MFRLGSLIVAVRIVLHRVGRRRTRLLLDENFEYVPTDNVVDGIDVIFITLGV